MTWYIVVTCEQCNSTIFLFQDLTEGKSVLDAHYIVTCAKCAHKGGYLARHYYHSLEQQLNRPVALAAARRQAIAASLELLERKRDFAPG